MSTFAENCKAFSQRLMRWSAPVLLVCLLLYPLVPNQNLKYILLGLLGGALMRILLDIENSLGKKMDGTHAIVNDGLAKVAGKLDSHHSEEVARDRAMHTEVVAMIRGKPQSWPDFPRAQHSMLEDIHEAIRERKGVHIDVLGVSAKYSWKWLEDEMPGLLKLSRAHASPFSISLYVCKEEVLHNWNLPLWVAELRRTHAGLEETRREYQPTILEGHLTLELFSYDSIPMWHGLLIDGMTLYLGRMRWEFADNKPPKLHVGMCEYRKFTRDDHYGGGPRIEMFLNWTERLRRRANELRASHGEA